MNPIKSQLKRDLGPEERAYIYQKINEFSSFFTPDSHALVHIKKESGSYVVNFQLTGPGASLLSEGVSRDLYSAVNKAQEDILSHIRSIQQEATSEEERQAEIIWHKNGGYIQ